MYGRNVHRAKSFLTFTIIIENPRMFLWKSLGFSSVLRRCDGKPVSVGLRQGKTPPAIVTENIFTDYCFPIQESRNESLIWRHSPSIINEANLWPITDPLRYLFNFKKKKITSFRRHTRTFFRVSLQVIVTFFQQKHNIISKLTGI